MSPRIHYYSCVLDGSLFILSSLNQESEEEGEDIDQEEDVVVEEEEVEEDKTEEEKQENEWVEEERKTHSKEQEDKQVIGSIIDNDNLTVKPGGLVLGICPRIKSKTNYYKLAQSILKCKFPSVDKPLRI